jgi:hypothetical protein
MSIQSKVAARPTADSCPEASVWKLLGKAVPWPKTVLARVRVRPEQRLEGLQITHIGHASYLIQAGGFNILVDPVWAERASPMKWMGPRRYNPPAVIFEDLPPMTVARGVIFVWHRIDSFPR